MAKGAQRILGTRLIFTVSRGAEDTCGARWIDPGLSGAASRQNPDGPPGRTWQPLAAVGAVLRRRSPTPTPLRQCHDGIDCLVQGRGVEPQMLSRLRLFSETR